MTHPVVLRVCKEPVSDRQTQSVFDTENPKQQNVSAFSEVIISLYNIFEERVMCSNDSDIQTGSTYPYSKPNQMHQCIEFILFRGDTLHVSDGLSVHRQEFKTVHTAVYSLELLMMYGKTVRNM